MNGDIRLANTNEVGEIFKFFSLVPGLYDFHVDQVIISGKEPENNFSELLKRVRSINLKMHHIPQNFSFDLPL